MNNLKSGRPTHMICLLMLLNQDGSAVQLQGLKMDWETGFCLNTYSAWKTILVLIRLYLKMGKRDALTHDDARQKVCTWCGKKSKDVRKITAAVLNILESKIPEIIPAKPDEDERIPSGIDSGCRKALQKGDPKALPTPFDYG